MLKHEVPAFVYVSIKRRKWFTYEDFKREYHAYPWPKEHGKPPFPSPTFLEGRLVQGKTGAYPRRNIHYHWTAAQV